MAASFSAITQYPDHHFLYEIFTIPWKHIVTRPTWTNVAGTFEHTFEHTLNDLRTEPQDFTLSQGGVGTTRFQKSRRWQSECYARVHSPQAFVLENTRADSIWPEAWMKLPEKQKKRDCQMEKESTQLHEDKREASTQCPPRTGIISEPTLNVTIHEVALFNACVVKYVCPGTCTDTPGFYLLREA